MRGATDPNKKAVEGEIIDVDKAVVGHGNFDSGNFVNYWRTKRIEKSLAIEIWIMPGCMGISMRVI